MADQWEIKFKREGPFMPFGSIMHAYSQINQGKGIKVDQMVRDAKKLFDLAQKLVAEAIENTKEKPKIIQIEEVEARQQGKEFQEKYDKQSETEEINKDLETAQEADEEPVPPKTLEDYPKK